MRRRSRSAIEFPREKPLKLPPLGAVLPPLYGDGTGRVWDDAGHKWDGRGRVPVWLMETHSLEWRERITVVHDESKERP